MNLSGFPPIPGGKKRDVKKEGEKAKAPVKVKTADLESLAEQYGMDTAAVKNLVRDAVGLTFAEEAEGE
jgi:hypothetical protein